MKIRSYCNTRNMGIKDLAENDMVYSASRDPETKAIKFQLRTRDDKNHSFIVEMDEYEARRLMQNIHDTLSMWDNTVSSDERAFILAGKKIDAIKAYRTRTGADLKTAVNWVNDQWTKIRGN